MRRTLLRAASLPLLAALLIAGCQGKDDAPQPGGSTPMAALQTSIDLLKAGDFGSLWKQALPPADYAALRADWSRSNANPRPITADDRAKFDDTMRKLTAPDAETTLYAELQPKLAELEQQYKDQLPVLITMGDALAKRGVAQNQTLTDEQKTQANGVLDVLSSWAQNTPWFDQVKAKQAVGVAVATARQLDLKSPDELRAMDFDTAMKKYTLGYAGARQLLAVYGLSVDDTLNSIKLSQVENKDGRAIVKIDYTLLGKPLSTQSTMLQQDGRWYSESLLKNARESHRRLASQPAASGTSATTPAATGTR